MNPKPVFRLMLLACACLMLHTAYGQNQTQQQDQDQSTYDAHPLWNPFFYTHYGNEYRTASGKPGPKYWQNHVDYKINATLDTTEKMLTATVVIDYTNNSPDNLSYLWLQMDQNIYKKSSRGTATQNVSGGRFTNRSYTKGYQLKSVTIEGGKNAGKANYLVNDTRMQIRLKNPLKAQGGKTKIKISYSFKIPQYGTDRMGRLDTKNGWIYEIAQWYPRMCVYDDVKGWNTIPYLGAGEFYLEYGDIDYTVTAPADLLVVGAGVLQNPKDVLTNTERKRLDEASKSDKTVFIRSEEDMKKAQANPRKGMLTWHFHMTNTRDVAWAASKAFIWDAARINLTDGKKALAQSVYPVQSAGDSAWGRSTEFTKACIEEYSRMWYPFPYKVATNVAGIVHGMEYPGFVFCGYKSKGKGLWGVTIHEFGHSWYPMTVGSNERKFPFMDEGFNTFINDVCTKWFNNGEFYDKPNNHSMATRLFSKEMDPILTIPDVTQAYNLGVAAYYKPAMGLHILRQVILGEKRFDYAFRKYTQDWAFKHPTPWDFFHAIDNGAGEELDWFWREWFFTNDALDQGIKSVKYEDNDPSKGALITIENLKKMALPAIIEVRETNGKDSTFTLPAEIWQRGSTWTFEYPSTSKLQSVVLDPNNLLPDINSKNNEWKTVEKKPVPAGVTAESVVNKYLAAIGGKNKLDAVKDMSMTASGSVQGQEILFSRKYKLPDDFELEVKVPSMDNRIVSKVVMNGDSVSMQRMGQDIPVTPETKKSLKDELHLFPELQYLKSTYQLSIEGIEPVDGNDAYVLKVTDPNSNTSTVFYDVKTGLKIKETAERPTTTGSSSESTTTYSNYKEVKGIKFPFTQNSDVGGMGMELKVKDLKVNSGLTDADFK